MVLTYKYVGGRGGGGSTAPLPFFPYLPLLIQYLKKDLDQEYIQLLRRFRVLQWEEIIKSCVSIEFVIAPPRNYATDFAYLSGVCLPLYSLYY